MNGKHLIKVVLLASILTLSIGLSFAATSTKTTTNIPATSAAGALPQQSLQAQDSNGQVRPASSKRRNPTTQEHLWNLQGVDIKSVIAEISRETGKNFILDPQVQGKITILSSHPMGPKESYQVFLSSLRVLGYGVVPDGNNLKIVPVRDTASQARLANGQMPGQGDQMVVRLIPVHYVSAMQLIPALRPLLPTWGNLAAYSPSNAIIASGTAGGVDRIAQIIAQVDTPAANGIDVVRLQHAVADDIVKEVNKLVLAARANGANTNATLSADEQSNSVLIGGDQTSRIRLKVLIAKLDDEDATGTNNTQVVYLKYIQVKDILPILKGMVNQSVSYSMSSGASSSYSGGSSGSSGSSLGQASPQFLAAANSQLNNASLNSSSSSSNDKNKVTIVGDVTNNALVITANPTVMMQLRNVIVKLDVAPKQVLVESVIAEVDAQTAKQLGIEWGTATPDSSATTGLGGGAVSSYSYAGGGMGVGFVQSGDMRALIAMLASDTNSNIVSTPSVTVLNNSPADIEVGENVSQVSAAYNGGQQNNESYVPPTTYQDKQIGLTLKVIPQITGGNSVRLVIDQENSSIVDDASLKGQSPNAPTSEEKISTSVMVDNGQVLVLGGLINSQDRNVVNKVPVLGDIPLLGRLFQSHSTTKVKKDLMIFLRPVIVESKAQAQQLTEQRYDFMHDVAILNDNKQGDLIASSTLPQRHPDKLPSPFTASQ